MCATGCEVRDDRPFLVAGDGTAAGGCAVTFAPWFWDAICGWLIAIAVVVIAWCTTTPIANYRRRKANHTPRGDR